MNRSILLPIIISFIFFSSLVVDFYFRGHPFVDLVLSAYGVLWFFFLICGLVKGRVECVKIYVHYASVVFALMSATFFKWIGLFSTYDIESELRYFYIAIVVIAAFIYLFHRVFFIVTFKVIERVLWRV